MGSQYNQCLQTVISLLGVNQMQMTTNTKKTLHLVQQIFFERFIEDICLQKIKALGDNK